eukprot:9488-Eustigmatos_ZCMA.PRE.1
MRRRMSCYPEPYPLLPGLKVGVLKHRKWKVQFLTNTTGTELQCVIAGLNTGSVRHLHGPRSSFTVPFRW